MYTRSVGGVANTSSPKGRQAEIRICSGKDLGTCREGGESGEGGKSGRDSERKGGLGGGREMGKWIEERGEREGRREEGREGDRSEMGGGKRERLLGNQDLIPYWGGGGGGCCKRNCQCAIRLVPEKNPRTCTCYLLL